MLESGLGKEYTLVRKKTNHSHKKARAFNENKEIGQMYLAEAIKQSESRTKEGQHKNKINKLNITDEDDLKKYQKNLNKQIESYKEEMQGKIRGDSVTLEDVIVNESIMNKLKQTLQFLISDLIYARSSPPCLSNCGSLRVDRIL